MTMATSSQRKPLVENNIASRALLQSQFSPTWSNDDAKSRQTPFTTVQLLDQRKLQVQIGPHGSAKSPFAISELTSEPQNQNTGFLPNIENQKPVEASAFVAKEKQRSDARTPSVVRSKTPSPLLSSASRQESPKLERSDSVLSRGSSQQAKYHDNCNPQIDPSLIIGNSRRPVSARPRTKRPASLKRPGSETSVLGRRESVTNLVYSGPSTLDGCDEGAGWETLYKKRLSLGAFSYSSSFLSRMASPVRDVTPGEFDVVQDDDVSMQGTKLTSHSSRRQTPLPNRQGFIYQVVSFDNLSKETPDFVRNYTQKNGKLLTESFILRINYLRRRRQLGEVSSTINIGKNSHKRLPTGKEKSADSPR